MLDLQAIFGDGPVVTEEVVTRFQVVPPGVDDDGGRFADWVRRPDFHGRMGWKAPDLPEVMPFDDLPLPGPPCPKCGSLEQWQDGLGRERCGNCEREILDKALELAEHAAWLRKQAQPRKPAPRIAPRCVPTVSVDTQDLGQERPLQRFLEGFVGV